MARCITTKIRNGNDKSLRYVFFRGQSSPISERLDHRRLILPSEACDGRSIRPVTGSLSGLVPFAPEYRKFLKFPVFSQLAGNLAIQRRVRSRLPPPARSPA